MLSAQQLFNLGLSNERRGSIDRALHFYSSIIVSWPQEMAPYHRLSVIAFQRRDFSLALAWTDKAIAINDSVVEIWNNRALALAELQRFDEAESAFQKVVELQADNWEAHYNLGRMYLVQKRFQEAETVLRRAAELDPYSAATFNNLGFAYHELCQYDKASEAFDTAIELLPDYVEAISNKGLSLYLSGELKEASKEFRQALELAPDSGTLHYSLASVLLSEGNLEEGFHEYEWRWRIMGRPTLRDYPQPQWNGEPLNGRILFLWPERGLGDTIQFIRFIIEIAKTDCELIVEVPNELYRLVVASITLTNIRFVHSGAKIPDFDVHAPLTSLPRLLHVQYETFHTFRPYLHPRSGELDEWRRKIKSITPAEHRKKRRIGIAWSGDPSHPNDHLRSISWETFAPIVAANKKRFQFFSLQPGKHPEDPDVIDLGDSLRDFGVTAAIVANLDMVITVDTSLLHLAGSMGKRTWAMLTHVPDWRWKIGEERTPWYSSLLLLSQKNPGSWEDVIQDVNETLALE